MENLHVSQPEWPPCREKRSQPHLMFWEMQIKMTGNAILSDNNKHIKLAQNKKMKLNLVLVGIVKSTQIRDWGEM